jgi:hypothetical protein
MLRCAMKVSDTRQVLFVHVPKNGGSTVDWVFDREVPDSRWVEGRGRHSGYKTLLAKEPALGEYWSFGFVRNPWSRMVSWYSMMSGIVAKADSGKERAVRRFEERPDRWEPVRPFVSDFDTFVLKGTEQVGRFARPQRRWLLRPDGTEIDFVGRVENFAHDLQVVRDKLGLAPMRRPPRRNRSTHGHYSEYYTPETRQRVADLFAEDIEAYGYTFETVS